jgi:diguanylate cyclase (GGDEF)-like protein
MRIGIALKLSVLLAVVGVLTAGTTGYYAHKVSRDLLVRSAKNELLTSTQLLARQLMLMRDEIERNLRILAAHPATIAALQYGEETDEDQVAVLFELMMAANPGYFQIRLIAAGDNGLERVRVDRDDSRPIRVTGDELQEKGHYPYVYDTLTLPGGGIYLSRIVINHEHGTHAGLDQPTVQLATPVTDAGGKALGVAVINVDLNGAFGLLAADLPQDFMLFLTNDRGDYLIHPDRTQAFGFDRGRRVLVQDEFPGTQDLIAGKTEYVLTEARSGRYAAAPILAAFISRNVKDTSTESRLLFGLAKPLTSVLAQADKLGIVILQIVLGLCFVCVVLAIIVARYVTRPINSMSAAVQRFAESRHSDGLPLERQDEIGVLARSFHDMRHQIKHQLAELQRSREELEHLARHDALTGLPNRVLFFDRVEQALIAVRRDQTHLALMFIDLDHFKPINDTLGHAFGDSLLHEIAKRIRAAVRESDTPARIGGDEFVVLLRNVQHAEDALTVAEKIRQALNDPFTIEEHTVTVSASMGIAMYPDDGTDSLELSKHADDAMYRAKQNGRNAVVFYADTGFAAGGPIPGEDPLLSSD